MYRTFKAFLLILVLVESAQADWFRYAWPSDRAVRGAVLYVPLWSSNETSVITNRIPADSVGTNGVVEIWTNTHPAFILEVTNQMWGVIEFGSPPPGEIDNASRTNAILEIREIQQHEVFRSIRERLEFIFYQLNPYSFQITPPHLYQNYYYRNQRDNLVAAKSILSQLEVNEVDPLVLRYFISNTNADLAGLAPSEITTYTPISLAVAAGAPSNFWYWTNYRDLDGGGVKYTTYTTNTMVIWDGTTNAMATVTNIDMWGWPHILSGSNGAVVTVVATNFNILEGFDSSHYTYKMFPAIMRKLGRVYGGTPTMIGGARTGGCSLNSSTYAEVVDCWPAYSDEYTWQDSMDCNPGSSSAWATRWVELTFCDTKTTWECFGFHVIENKSRGVDFVYATNATTSLSVSSKLTTTFSVDLYGAAQIFSDFNFDSLGSPYATTNTLYRLAYASNINPATTTNVTLSVALDDVDLLATTPSCVAATPANVNNASEQCCETLSKGYSASSPFIVYRPRFEFGNYVPQ
jgi:hypothetical protein